MQPRECQLWRGSRAWLPEPSPAPQPLQSQPQRQHLSRWSRSRAAAQCAALECSAAHSGSVQPKKVRRAAGGTGSRSMCRGREAAAHGSDTVLGRAHAAMDAQQRLLADDVEDDGAASDALPATGDRARVVADVESVRSASSAVQRLQRDGSAAAAGRDAAANSRGNVGRGVPITAEPPKRRPPPVVDPLSSGGGESDDSLTSERDLDSSSSGSSSTEGPITRTVDGSAREGGNDLKSTGAQSAAVAEYLPAGKWNRKQRGQYFRTRQRELRADKSAAEYQRERQLHLQNQQELQQQQQQQRMLLQREQRLPLQQQRQQRQQERQQWQQEWQSHQQHQHRHHQQVRDLRRHQQQQRHLSEQQQLHQQTLQREHLPPAVVADDAQRNLAAAARAAADLARQGVTQPRRPSLPHDCVDLVGAGSRGLT